MASKIRTNAQEAIADLACDGMTILVGGFGLSGVPVDLVQAIRDTGVKGLTIVSNNMGIDGEGLGLLLDSGQVTNVVCSYAGENATLARMYMDGSLTIEFAPQGTLAERMRAGGAGIAGFYTRTGVGTLVAEGKPHQEFDGVTYLFERGIVGDLALVRAHVADQEGNLIYRHTARNFNPVVATAGKVTIVEAEKIVPVGSIDPNVVITPGIFVNRIVLATMRTKPIEHRTVRVRETQSAGER